jgi:hypothetical protein
MADPCRLSSPWRRTPPEAAGVLAHGLQIQRRERLPAGGSRIRTIGPAVEERPFRRPTFLFPRQRLGSVTIPERDRWFESTSLQRRVCELSVPRRRTLILVLGWSAIAQIPKLIGRELESTRCVRASCILAPEPTAANWPPGCTARQARWFGRLRARLLTVARLGSHEIDGLLLLHPHEQPAR